MVRVVHGGIGQNMKKTLSDFYCGEVPGYIIKATKDYMIVRMGDIITNKPKEYKITIDDIVEFHHFYSQGNNWMSGGRTLAGIMGDHRPMTELAKEVLEWFKYSNINVLRRKSKAVGLTPKF